MYRGSPQVVYIDLESTGAIRSGAGSIANTQKAESGNPGFQSELRAFINKLDLNLPNLYDPHTEKGRQINIDCNREIAIRVKDLNCRQAYESRTAPMQDRKLELKESDLLQTISTFLDSLSSSNDLLRNPPSNSKDLIQAATVICYQITKDIQACRLDFTASAKNSLADFRLLHPLFCLGLEDKANQPHAHRNLAALHKILFQELDRTEAIQYLKKAALTVGALYLKSSLANHSNTSDGHAYRHDVFFGAVLPVADRSRLRHKDW